MVDIKHSTYHRVLRVSALTCAFVLLFESGLVHSSTALLSQNTHQYLANAVGVGASIEPTELNMVTAELTAAKMELQREREINVGLAQGQGGNQAIYILSGILFILLVLIVLNYALDYLRYRDQKLLRLKEAV
ncbi:MAG: hypothetical protein KBB78_03440 [Candidatus Pacebacteria bacterium]|nr:hypothetical protein [Candidatus Paceibacterota bacterium]